MTKLGQVTRCPLGLSFHMQFLAAANDGDVNPPPVLQCLDSDLIRAIIMSDITAAALSVVDILP
jgi:hypothetical protein